MVRARHRAADQAPEGRVQEYVGSVDNLDDTRNGGHLAVARAHLPDGMAANDSDNSIPPQSGPYNCLSRAELVARLNEEVSRAGRHRTALSCLLVSLLEVERLASTHGQELPAQALDYLGAALGRQLRRFDRVGYWEDGELLVVLPGADERRGEIVARRALGRLHAVKIEVKGERQPLRISVGVAAWREGLSADQLLAQTRLAAQRRDRFDSLSAQQTGQTRTLGGDLPAVGRS
jgi:diguanylate cyclase (GGDEF)-like protein